ncbi:snoRNA-binding protein [Bulinus truncatus]|nr:snoRNA-binding protein [Bulinus truncatus]
MGKSRKSDVVEQTDDNDESVLTGKTKVSWEEKVKYLSPIARPLATKRLTRKLYKLINKAKGKNSLYKGIKEVQKRLRKGDTGIVVLAGDVSPMDIITHIPVMCEERDIPYCYTPSKSELGESYGTKRQACIVLIKENDDYNQLFNECKAKISEIPQDY